jgi:hypothetical protein
MARKVGHALHDILEAIERVEEITRGTTFSDFSNSWQPVGSFSERLKSYRKQAARFRTI